MGTGHSGRARSGPGRALASVAVALAVVGSLLGAASGTAVAQAGSGSFSDDDGSVHEPALDELASQGVLAGMECGEGLICPSQPLKRWEMAVWLVRILDGADPAPVDSSRFEDIDVQLWWAPFVERLFELEVTGGCATEPARFCADRDVTRAEMATFLTRAFALQPAAEAGFTDVDPSGPHAADIDALAAAGVTAGCSRDPLRYCPAGSVTRAEMATFLARAAGLMEGSPSVQYTAVDVDSNHACALRTDGAIACWGFNSHGRTDAPDGEFRAVAVGDEHSCGLRDDAVITCWGNNNHGQADAPDGQFEAVSAGGSHSCGLRDDAVITCWGNNNHGQADAPDGQFEAVSAGGSHTCGLRDDAVITCWGDESSGSTVAPDGQFRAVSAGAAHTCGLRTDRSVTCWGRNGWGQANSPAGVFKAVTAGSTHSCGLLTGGTVTCWGGGFIGEADPPPGMFQSIAAGGHRTCGVTVDGTVECWGNDYDGPAEAPPGQFRTVTAGRYHQCGLRLDGTVDCWGHNRRGESSAPYGRFMAISAGFNHSCGVRLDGAVDCWGDSGRGQTDEPEGAFVDVASGRYYSCGIRTDGTVECWGQVPETFRTTIRGQFTSIAADLTWMCGLRLDGSVSCQGAQADPPEGKFDSVSVGESHGCGVRAQGEIACWGDNTFGQTDVPEGRFEAVAAGGRHSCGLRGDGTTVCWGDDSTGQSGPPDVQLTAVAAGLWYSCGLDTSNSIVCWGDAWNDPAPAGVSRVTGTNWPDPRRCRPWAPGGLSSGFPLAAFGPPTVGSLRIAVLFVDFRNASALNTAQQESLKGLSYMKRYLESTSYRKLRIEFIPLFRWLQAERGYSHYEGPTAVTGSTHVTRAIDFEAVRLADPDFDFSGVDVVMIVMPSAHFAGGNALGEVRTDEGRASTLRVNTFHGASTSNWGPTAVHELAHNLGLPDLYPYTANQHFVPVVPPEGKAWRQVTLGLMGLTAAVPVDGRDPGGFTYASEMLAWSRWQLGWLDDGQIRCISEPTATVTLSPVADPGDGIAMAAVPVSADELIVIESRRRIGYDERSGVGDGAVVVYTVEAALGNGDLPIKLAGDAGRGHTFVSPILDVGESVTVWGYTITVTADDGDTHTVTITRDGRGE